MASHVVLAEVYKGYSSLVLQATAWHSDGYSRLMEATLKLGVFRCRCSTWGRGMHGIAGVGAVHADGIKLGSWRF
uniref:Uncharacterized protein n=1 Tax=Vitis vinifera TaxID=29760 RepID=A5AHA9_VITVI|nr:hypothetical protein VITISV_004090 [Vitis vinifera]